MHLPETRFQNPYFQPAKSFTAWRRDWWAYLGSAALIGFLMWYAVAQRQWLWVDTIELSGNAYLSNEQVEAAVNQALAAKRWFIVPQRFYPLLNENRLASATRELLEQTIGLAELRVESKFPDIVEITLVERIPGYVYINNDQYFYLDEAGVITKQVKLDELDPHFPHIRERNKKRQVAVGDSALNSTIMNFIANLVTDFTTRTSLAVSEFAVLPITCQTKQYVADKIFAEEIAGSSDETIKKKKRDILEQLQNEAISVDQSLTLLEEVKRSEKNTAKESTDSEVATFITWEAQFVNSKCDYLAVVQDIAVVTQPGVEIYFSSQLDQAQQLDNVALLIENKTVDPLVTKYVDVRFIDRAYYR